MNQKVVAILIPIKPAHSESQLRRNKAARQRELSPRNRKFGYHLTQSDLLVVRLEHTRGVAMQYVP